MAESIQKKLMRIRPPRVKITYDVETGGAIEARELPFIVGIFADLSGAKPANEKPPIKERKFVEIDAATFDEVMGAIAPGIEFLYVPYLEDAPAAGDAPATAPAAAADAATAAATSAATPAAATADEAPAEPRKTKGSLVFRCLDDFLPSNIVARFEPLKNVFDVRVALRDFQSQIESNEELEILAEAFIKSDERGNELRQLLKKAFPQDGTAQAQADPLLADVLGEKYKSLVPAHLEDPDPKRLASFNRTLDLVVSQIDRMTEHHARVPAVPSKVLDLMVLEQDHRMGFVLNQILHASEFQELEASWRGLHYLVSRTETGVLLKLRLLNISRDELAENLAKAVEFDQSHVFKLIYEAEYGTLGGTPYSVLMGDYCFGRDEPSITLLENIAKVAAAAHAPFIAAVSPDMFGLPSFELLAKPRDLAQIFESPELNQWHGFRSSEDSRYITLVLPKVLLRLPHEVHTQGKQAVSFTERVQPDVTLPTGEIADDSFPGILDESRCLWGNPAYVLAERITNAFAHYRWTAAIRGVEGGGLVEDLPNYTYKTPTGEIALLCPTQVSITDRREQELNKLGFVALCHCKGTNKAAFFGSQTTNSPKVYLNDTATANAALSSRLPYILAASRFAHYIKVIMRDKIGSFQTQGQIAAHLNQWVSQYVLLDDFAGQESKAAYPLRAAQVNVTEVASQPGTFQAVMFLRPHFQLEELTTSIRLVTQLPG